MFPSRPGERERAVGRDLSLTVDDNAKHLTVAACWENLMRLDELIAANGEKPRYLESREFFSRQLQRCLKKRESERPDFGE
jgi:hypothetical protein